METLKQYLLAFGLPGLFLIAFMDSAGVPLPGGGESLRQRLEHRMRQDSAACRSLRPAAP